MPRRAFLSFSYDDTAQASGFNLLQWNPNVDFDFVGRHLLSKVDSENDDYIKSRIREEMHGTSMLICLIGQTTHQSPWVDWEIREAMAQGKGILGIRLKGQEGAPIPPALQEAGANVIDWNPDAFGDEMEQAALIANRPELGPPPTRYASSGGCG